MVEDLHTIVFDFDGVFTDNAVYVSDEGREFVRCSRSDGLGLDLLRRYRDRVAPTLEIFVLSTETNPVVTARAKKMKLACRQSVNDKVRAVDEYFAERRPGDATPYAGLLFVGNDLNDLALIQRAAYSVVPSDAHVLVREAARFTLPETGGHGFVRALIERLLRIDHMSVEDLRGLISDC